MADDASRDADTLVLPGRYDPLRRLGRGGGGEVWAVGDRCDGGHELALKVLTRGYGAAEVDALIRETVALSGLEGLGLPRVSNFGRLPDGRPYLVRELVDGESLEAALTSRAGMDLLEWLARAAEVVTHLHRAGLLHGDIKPANIIVRADGSVTLVDLGLAAAWQERGAIPEGLTPHYAAPEVIAGRGLTARSEIYSLGVVLREILEGRALHLERAPELEAVMRRATSSEPSQRYPSADEFASALRRAADLPPLSHETPDEHWPVEGMDRTAAELLAVVAELEPGGLVRVEGPRGSGRTTLLRRVAWTLAMRGTNSVWLDEALSAEPRAARSELLRADAEVVLVDAPTHGDGSEALQGLRELLHRQLAGGARLVIAGDLQVEGQNPARLFDMPPLDPSAACRLLRRAMPSLTDALVQRIVEATGARPGALRQLVARTRSMTLASSEELEQLLAYDETLAEAPSDPEEAALFYLDRGRFTQARRALERGAVDSKAACGARRAWLEARWQLGAGTAAQALAVLESWQEFREDEELGALLRACRGRALLGVGRYADALDALASAESFPRRARIEALAYRGLGQALLGQRQAARETLEAALSAAEQTQAPRLEALVSSAFATAEWRADRLTEAVALYRRATEAAESVGDAGILSSAQINLAALLKVQGELAPALDMLEAAVDTARRSGRRATLHQALLNLANADLYLGRLERAKGSISALDEGALTPVAQAQLVGLRAEFAERAGRANEAVERYVACQRAWAALGRKRDAAEAALESIIVAVRAGGFEPKLLEARLEEARGLLGEEDTHRALLRLAEARLLFSLGEERAAERRCAEALQAAEEGGQREWIWRTLELSAELLEATGRPQRASRVRQRALEVVEDIGASLPRDLREVYWNDARRRQLRASLRAPAPASEAGTAAQAQAPAKATTLPFLSATPGAPGAAAVSRLTQTPLEQRLARILAVNHDLAGEVELDRLCQKIVAHAAELVGADRAFLLLGGEGERLEVQATLGPGAEAQREFSSSVAHEVVQSGQPLVSIDAARDGRLEGYASVHQRMVRGVACVPVLDPRGAVIGALHLETRGAPSPHFADELPTLRAFAEQAAIALENARLLGELKARTAELETSNRKLAMAQERLEEVLEARTARLKAARRELRSTRQALEAHYTYAGLVGTSEAMRRVYAMIERIKNTDVPVLITGESGTGKEVVARAIHQSSPRKAAKFLGVNCGAIPEQLLESELFGHTRGAFTGADRERKGLFREAEGGSLLLDEIGETPAKMQTGLLRVLQERTVRPLGGQHEEPVDVRVIFATNQDLEALVASGRFRADLLYRIRVVELRLPPLRERADDIPQLVDHFFGRFATRFDRPKKSLSREALHRLLAYDWPGNVRQFENVLLNAWVLGEGDLVDVEDLELPDAGARVSSGLSSSGLSSSGPSSSGLSSSGPSSSGLSSSGPSSSGLSSSGPSSSPVTTSSGAPTPLAARQTTSQHRRDERRRIVDALKTCNWNRAKAAELIGMPRRTFYRRLHEYGIQ